MNRSNRDKTGIYVLTPGTRKRGRKPVLCLCTCGDGYARSNKRQEQLWERSESFSFILVITHERFICTEPKQMTKPLTWQVLESSICLPSSLFPTSNLLYYIFWEVDLHMIMIGLAQLTSLWDMLICNWLDRWRSHGITWFGFN
jgi:hypothetical protein